MLGILNLFFNSSPNRKLIIDETLAMFKPTVHLKYHQSIDDIKEIELSGIFVAQHADEKRRGDYILTNKHKIQKVIDYLNRIPLAKATEDELPNKSADGSIKIYNVNGKEVGNFIIYGQVFIKDLITQKLYRSKKDWIIDGIGKMEFD